MSIQNAALRILEPEPSELSFRGVREQMGANRAAVHAAERAHLDATVESVSWERRGPFGRLVQKEAA